MIRLPAERSKTLSGRSERERVKRPALSLTDWERSGLFEKVQSVDCDTKMILKICAKQINH